jgi:hypothetical protein
LGSINEDTQTWPSMDAEPMYIWFDGVLGTGVCWGLRGSRPVCDVGFLAGASSGALVGEPIWLTKDCVRGSGETERAVTEADGWALYVRRIWKDGMLKVCC